MSRRRYAISLLVALATVVAVPSNAGAGVSNFSMSPTSGPPGTTVSVSGTGCAPGLLLSPSQDFVAVSATTAPPVSAHVAVAADRRVERHDLDSHERGRRNRGRVRNLCQRRPPILAHDLRSEILHGHPAARGDDTRHRRADDDSVNEPYRWSGNDDHQRARHDGRDDADFHDREHDLDDDLRVDGQPAQEPRPQRRKRRGRGWHDRHRPFHAWYGERRWERARRSVRGKRVRRLAPQRSPRRQRSIGRTRRRSRRSDPRQHRHWRRLGRARLGRMAFARRRVRRACRARTVDVLVAPPRHRSSLRGAPDIAGPTTARTGRAGRTRPVAPSPSATHANVRVRVASCGRPIIRRMAVRLAAQTVLTAGGGVASSERMARRTCERHRAQSRRRRFGLAEPECFEGFQSGGLDRWIQTGGD